jgi:hypothetical protein
LPLLLQVPFPEVMELLVLGEVGLELVAEQLLIIREDDLILERLVAFLNCLF